ncbi:MAG TPA: class III extradiol ring-cleavage dioxygenase [Burkholderiaceae bacterium]|nr:class III extradiol ring-cleavage dioxygenase [Burkholderiaceae bacterium]HQZ06260.1 class III extradiol ring-cleavage dioxygenase [Burkholderiaceae bacterium]HRA61851.1 class III extradiol ring-cleavage dioxygenase [Burkholderiaceae bacterium]
MRVPAIMPSVYLPHGGGPAFFMEGGMGTMFRPMGEFLSSFHTLLPAKPSAILVVTAHWEAPVPTFCGAASPALIYDYYGFPKETYALTYPAPGAPALAARAAGLLRKAAIETRVDPEYGWDHGVFIPLKVMYPAADVPVLAMSLKAGLDPLQHVAIGQALRPLRDDGVLIMGSGMSYHNLRQMGNSAAALDFDRWLDGALAGDASHRSAWLAQWARAPAGRTSHPREEHLLPLMVASGAGGDASGRKLWSGGVGATAVAAWAFD